MKVEPEVAFEPRDVVVELLLALRAVCKNDGKRPVEHLGHVDRRNRVARRQHAKQVRRVARGCDWRACGNGGQRQRENQ